MTNMIQIQQGLEETNMVMMMQKKQQQQGIVTILGSNCDINTPSSEYSSLRRTLSADMSSQKWLSHKSEELLMQHSSTNKTIADSSLSSPSEEEDEAERERLEIWSSIQRNKKEEQEKAGPGGAFDMWNSLVSLKDNSKSLPATPYVHPLVKRSKSCLSEKSLEICTESLGSETGSDGLFSSYPSSETEEEEKQEEKEQVKVVEQQQEEEQEPKNNYTTKKYSPSSSSSSSRSFPPPLPSLGPSLHMRTRRDNGRLVLEAVSVPNNNNFSVQRQGGRLVLTFANQETKDEDAAADADAAADEVAEENSDDDGVAVDELEEEFEGFDEEEREDDETEAEDEDESDETEEVEDIKDVESVVIEKVAPLVSSEITTATTTNGVHRLAFMMNKSIGLVNRKPEWSEKLNEVDVNVVEVETGPVAKSLPPRPRVARLIPSTNFNAYEYYWKTKPAAAAAAEGGTTATATTLSNSMPHHQKQYNNITTSTTLVNNNKINKVIFSGDFKQMSYDQRQQLMVVREKNGDYKLVHNLDQSCKDSRRSFLFWEPYCIATS